MNAIATLSRYLLTHVICCLIFCTLAYAANNTLEKISLTQPTDNSLQATFTLSTALVGDAAFSSFITQYPKRLIIDLPAVDNHLKKPSIETNPLVSHITITQAAARTRIMLELKRNVGYQLKPVNNQLVLTMALQEANKNIATTSILNKPNTNHNQIKLIDFKRNPGNAAQLIVKLTKPGSEVDLQQQGSSLYLEFFDTQLPNHLRKNMDVSDFGSPVNNIVLHQQEQNVKIHINTHGKYTHLAYQTEDTFVLDINPIAENEKTENAVLKNNFTGDKISLNFQNIEIRSVLQLLAEFTGLNIVTDDSVQGTITLHLQNIPWDQALSIILKTRGLAERQIGNVILVAPAKDIADREKEELQSHNQIQDMSPLRSELIQVNYARATDVAQLIQSQQGSLLSTRGKISTDTRTNTIWLLESNQKLDELRELIKKLDIPVSQVSIEARIVKVNKDMTNELGVKFGVTKPQMNLTGNFSGANSIANGTALAEVATNGTDRLNVNLPAATATTGNIGLALAKLGHGFLLDLELSALETEGKGNIISSPHVITANQHAALIESGKEVPYQQFTSSGAANVAFKKAVLSLEVTPQITPDNKIVLSIKVHNDDVGSVTSTTVPIINTENIETQVLVDNGETVVLGGIYKQNKTNTISRIPFFSSIPVLGNLFKNRQDINNRSELLVFITPKIITQAGLPG